MPTSARKRLDGGERVNPVLPVHVWQSPAASATRLIVVTRLDVYAAIHASTTDSLPHETGGFLLGRVACDEQARHWVLEIDETIPAEPLEQDLVHFSFSWRDVDRVRRYREERQKALLGWYHSHPNLGIFLSETDVERTHRLLFAEPFQVALVYDPVCGRAGYFFWEGRQTIDTSQALWREFVIAAAPDAQPEHAGEIGHESDGEPPLKAPSSDVPAVGSEPDAEVVRAPDARTNPSLPPGTPGDGTDATPDAGRADAAARDAPPAPSAAPSAPVESQGEHGNRAPRARKGTRSLTLRLTLLCLLTGGVVAVLALLTMWGR